MEAQVFTSSVERESHPYRHLTDTQDAVETSVSTNKRTTPPAQAQRKSRSDPSKPRSRSSQACEACRKRKVKCDQQIPCLSCERAGIAHECTFTPAAKRRPGVILQKYGPNGPDFAPPNTATVGGSTYPTPGLAVWNSPYSQPSLYRPPQEIPSRISDSLKRHGATNDNEGPSRKSPKLTDAKDRNGGQPEMVNSQPDGTVQIKGSKSTYLQPMHPNVLLLQMLPEVQSFLSKIVHEPESFAKLSRLRQDYPKPLEDPPLHELRSTSLLEFIPAQPACNRLLETFFDTCGNVLQILDKTTFHSQYHEFGRREENSEGNTTTSTFLCKLALIVALASDLDHADAMTSSRKTLLCEEIDVRLRDNRHETRFTIERLETSCLLFLVRRSVHLGAHEAWHATGQLASMAMSMGFHQNPAMIEQLDLEQQIARRRLWTAILELDIQACLSAGMRPFIRPTELVPGSLAVSHQVAVNEGDPASNHTLSHHLADSLPRRLALANGVGSGGIRGDLHDFLAKSNTIRLLTGGEHDRTSGSHALLSKVLADLFHCRPFLAASQLMAVQADRQQAPKAAKAHADCIDLALKILGLLDTFDSEVADLPASEASMCWHYLAREHFDTFLQAAYVLCVEINCFENRMSPSIHSKATILHSLNRLLSGFLDSVSDFAIHVKEVLRFAIIIQYVRSNSLYERKQELMRQAFDRVVATFTKHADVSRGLNGQEDNLYGIEWPETVSQDDLFDWGLYSFDLDMPQPIDGGTIE